MRNNDGKLAGNTDEKNIRFCRGVAAGLSANNTHIDFQMVNRTFYDSPYFIKRIPFFRISLNPREHAEIQILVGICGTPLCCAGTGIVIITDIFSFDHMNLGKNPFDTVSTSLFAGDTAMLHGKGRVIGTGGIAVFIVADFFEGTFISCIIRNENF